MKRYDIYIGVEHGIDGGVPCIETDEDNNGDWVRYEDVEKARSDGARSACAFIGQQVGKRLGIVEYTWQPTENAIAKEMHRLLDELSALRETLNARQVAAEYSRRQCEKAEAALRVAEMLLADCANWLITAPEDARDGDESKRLIELRETIRKELKLT